MVTSALCALEGWVLSELCLVSDDAADDDGDVEERDHVKGPVIGFK